jgi:serine/threonine-protein kinase PpkA
VDDLLGSAWSMAVGTEALRLTGAEFATGRAAALAFASSTTPRTFVEILGFDKRSGEGSDFAAVHGAVFDAVRENQDITGCGAPEAAEYDRPALPARAPIESAGVEGYRALERLGEGGMSKVFLAEHESSGERRVLKMIPIDDDEDMLQRFLQEYALIAQVRHPNVARIYEQGFGEHCAYIAMEHLSGGDLRDRLRDPLPVPEALRYLTQIALGLTAIHHRGIIHRDLKPENLMFRSDGLLVLADFGIAKQLSTELTRTQHGEVYGTPYYMSPEQARGLTVDGRSDLYSLGIILYEMLAGAKPYNATRAEAIVYQHIHSPIPRLPAQCASIQPLLDRLLAKEPEDRFETSLELMRVIRNRQDAPQVAAPPADREAPHALGSE